jgi:hypothetical protein
MPDRQETAEARARALPVPSNEERRRRGVSTRIQALIEECREKAEAGQDTADMAILVLVTESVERHLSAVERIAVALEKIAGAVSTQQRAV